MTLGILKLIFILAGIIIIFAHLKSRRPLLSILQSVLQGTLALIAVNIIGSFINVGLGYSVPIIAVSAVGGIPAVILLLMCDALL